MTDRKEAELINVSSKVRDGAAVAIAVASGALVADDSLKDGCYQQYKNSWKDVKKLRADRAGEEERISLALKDIPGESARALRTLKKKFGEDVTKLFAGHGLRGRLDYWNSLTDTNRVKVIERTFTTVGIALGVLLTIANVKAISRIFSPNDTSETTAQEQIIARGSRHKVDKILARGDGNTKEADAPSPLR